jgi:hypothetical protein
VAGKPCDGAHAALPGERAALDLGAEELFVLGAFRAWVAPRMRPGAAHPDWRELFRLAGAPAAAAVGLDLLLSVVAAHAQRLIEVRCCACPSLGPDEEALLRLVAALQAGDSLDALDVLSDWLPPGMVAPALRGAQRFATLIAAAGLRLPAAARARVAATLH